MKPSVLITKLIKWSTPKFSDEENESEVESLVNRTQIIANFIIMLQVVSIIVAVVALMISMRNASKQEALTYKIDKNKNAIEAIGKIYNQTFLNNFNYFIQKDTISKEVEQSFFHLLNTYYVIAIIYESDIANNDIIEKSIKDGIGEFMDTKFYRHIQTDPDFYSVVSEIQSMSNSFK